MDEATADEELVAHVRRLADSARRVTSVCSGAFVLAAAGLLDLRRATTHWAEYQQLATAHPQVSVDNDAIYVRDGDVWTSAGVTAGIDLALALVADDHAAGAAAAVARHLVSTCGGPAGRRSSPRCSPPRRPRANRCGSCWRGCRPPDRRPVRARPGPPRATCPSDSSAGCSRPRSA
ncbi:DJ-1/PfpI family protein [Blastococcus haudaquaticus]|uniref:DJ-1/PfpI family protein n=1 Tax=Blastococcus haudaquaticus TaxID=1938745 RepID=UPI0034E27771